VLIYVHHGTFQIPESRRREAGGPFGAGSTALRMLCFVGFFIAFATRRHRSRSTLAWTRTSGRRRRSR
jgi:hypothetical protein